MYEHECIASGSGRVSVAYPVGRSTLLNKLRASLFHLESHSRISKPNVVVSVVPLANYFGRKSTRVLASTLFYVYALAIAFSFKPLTIFPSMTNHLQMVKMSG